MQRAMIVCAGLCLIAAMAAGGSQRSALESLSPAERANARLELGPAPDAPAEIADACRRIGQLWNDGQYDTALDQYRMMGDRYGEDRLTTAVSWRRPVPTIAAKWGTDVRIGNRDSVFAVHFDVHRASGHLMALTQYTQGTTVGCAVNMSTDLGSTWNEVYWISNVHMHGVSGAFLADHFYLAANMQNYASVRRFWAATGSQDTFSTGGGDVYVYLLGPPDTTLEAALCSNQDEYNNRLMYVSTTKTGLLRYHWSDTAAVSWTQIATGITNAQGGLDICYNEGNDSLYTWVSYFNAGDTVKIGAVSGSSGLWRNVSQVYSGAPETGTSIGAYHDTVLCAYNSHGATDYCRYRVSYNGGANWSVGTIGGTADTTADMPDVAMRKGGGQAVAYRFFGSTSEHLRYTWRYSGAWTTPVRMSDSAAFPCKPSIEYLGSAVYGVAFSSWAPEWGIPYFDRSDWVTGVAGDPPAMALPALAKVFPSPARDRATVSWSLPQPGKVDVAVYDLTGRLVSRTGLALMTAGRHELALDTKAYASGIYFVRIEGAGPGYTKKLVVIR